MIVISPRVKSPGVSSTFSHNRETKNKGIPSSKVHINIARLQLSSSQNNKRDAKNYPRKAQTDNTLERSTDQQHFGTRSNATRAKWTLLLYTASRHNASQVDPDIVTGGLKSYRRVPVQRHKRNKRKFLSIRTGKTRKQKKKRKTAAIYTTRGRAIQ